jgi:hypothetical protein
LHPADDWNKGEDLTLPYDIRESLLRYQQEEIEEVDRQRSTVILGYSGIENDEVYDNDSDKDGSEASFQRWWGNQEARLINEPRRNPNEPRRVLPALDLNNIDHLLPEDRSIYLLPN